MSDAPSKITALVLGNENFLGYYLKKYLNQQGCRLVSEAEIPLEKINYIFVLDPLEKGRVKKLFSSEANTFSKILVTIEGEDKPPFLSQGFDVRAVKLGEVYGPRMSKEKYEQLIGKQESLSNKPIFVSDAIYGLAKSMFSSGTRGKILFIPPSTWQETAATDRLNWRPTISWEDGLKETRLWFEKLDEKKSEAKPRPDFLPSIPGRQEQDKENLSGAKKPISSKPIKIALQTKRPFIFFIIALSLFVFSPLIAMGIDILIGMRNLREIKTKIQNQDASGITGLAQTAKFVFHDSQERLIGMSPVFKLFGQPRIVSEFYELLNAAENLSDGAENLGLALRDSQELGQAVLQGQSANLAFLVSKVTLESHQGYQSFSLAQPEIKNESYLRLIQEGRQLIFQAQKGLQVVPELVGLNGPRDYLILFQNSSELRPTGGFIGSYGLMSFDQGKIIDFEVRDVYVADGQLKGHVEPPADLKKYLGEAGWYLRDSNWDPDFPTSANRAGWFLEKETGRKVDGVIGFNLEAARRILEVLGEIELPDFQEKVTANSLFEKAEYHSEVNFFPGTTQKQDFLGQLGRVMFEKIRTADKATWLKLAGAIYNSLQSKNLMVYLNDPGSQAVISSMNWDGAIGREGCPAISRPCLADYLMVVDANVGVNKANYFLKRSYSQKVKILADGTVEENLRLLYKNESQTEIFPAGTYKNYLRVFVPKGSSLKTVTIKDSVTGEVRQLEPRDIETGEKNNLSYFGFLVEVPTQSIKSVEVNYQSAKKVSAEGGRYSLLIQKQSGIQDDSFGYSFEADPNFEVVQFVPLGRLGEDGVTFSPKFDRDLLFEVDLTKLTRSTSLGVNPEPAERLQS